MFLKCLYFLHFSTNEALYYSSGIGGMVGLCIVVVKTCRRIVSCACIHITALDNDSLFTSGCPQGTVWLTLDFCEMLCWVFLVKLTCSGLVKIRHRKHIIDVELHIFMNMAIHEPDILSWYAAHTS
jgi:hypothetical protein